MHFQGRVGAAALVLVCAACGGHRRASLSTFADSASYAIGLNMGGSLREVRQKVELAALQAGLEDAAEGRTPRFSDSAARRILQSFMTQLQEHVMSQRKLQGDSNRIAGDAYRAENAKRAGVHTTASGLQYEVLTEGTGPKPKPTDNVRVHYRGTLIDGKEFDDSHARGEPAVFAVDEVIPGWSEAVQLMPVGSKYRFVVPPELAYGEAGAAPDIPANATLVFEVELLAIDK
jgi:FKBP-type peptidyl-prolyl cis-trans isomerase FkpA